MNALWEKDIRLIRSNISALYLFPLVIGLAATAGNGIAGYWTLATLVSFLFAMQITVTLDYDASAPWKRLRMILPFEARTEIAAKYLLSLTALLASVVVNLVVSAPFWLAYEDDWNLFALGAAAACACAAFYLMIAIPAIYRFGASKGRMVLLCFVFLVAMVPTALSSMLGLSITEMISDLNSAMLVVIAMAIVTGGIICSVLASLRVIQRL